MGHSYGGALGHGYGGALGHGYGSLVLMVDARMHMCYVCIDMCVDMCADMCAEMWTLPIAATVWFQR